MVLYKQEIKCNVYTEVKEKCVLAFYICENAIVILPQCKLLLFILFISFSVHSGRKKCKNCEHLITNNILSKNGIQF